LRVVNEPPRGIGKVSLEHLRAYAEPRELSLLSAAAKVSEIPAIKGKAALGLRIFAQLMHELRPLAEASPDDVIRQVLDRTGYRQMYLDSTDEDDLERLANIEEFITAAHQFAAEDSSATLADFLETITLSSDVDSWDEDQDCVSIMTLHAAKGLEFPVVFMAAVEEGLLPHERSRENDDDVEEERRLAFVGMTRAKEELYLCHAGLREFRGMARYAIASQFLSQLPPAGIEQLDLSENQERVMDEWRGGSPAAEHAWDETGLAQQRLRIAPETRRPIEGEAPRQGDTETRRQGDGETRRRGERVAANGEPVNIYVEGMLVRHDAYGQGRVTQVTGYGVMRKIKVRFSGHGEKTFVADKAKLAIVGKNG
jgi:DNA helicase-2/ATP-dependent DNA helicase PcrA